MRIQDIYQKFQIMPQLATHMLRVGGIAKLITQDWRDQVVANKCVKACLVHDLGNITKFSLENPVMPVEDIDRWKQTQRDVRKKYGEDAHEVTYAMLRELGLVEYEDYLKEEAQMYVTDPRREDFVRMSKPALLVLYADLRVVPKGVVSMSERIDDLIARYGGNRAESRWGKDLELYIQTLSKTEVTSISDADVELLFDDLLTMDI